VKGICILENKLASSIVKLVKLLINSESELNLSTSSCVNLVTFYESTIHSLLKCIILSWNQAINLSISTESLEAGWSY
jgi:hypothetical protein